MLTGLDTNILCYALDPAYPEHKKLKNLLTNLSQENVVAINPTVLHETYHTLVFSQKWVPSEARKRLKMLLTHPYVEFFSQTKKTSTVALNLAVQYKLGGGTPSSSQTSCPTRFQSSILTTKNSWP